MRLKQTIWNWFMAGLVLLLVGGPASGLAATDLREAASASKPEDLQEIGKQLNNPVSSWPTRFRVRLALLPEITWKYRR